MTDETTNTPQTNIAHIVSHEFSGNTCKVLVEGPSLSTLQDPEMKKSVYEYRNTVGASHMGLNKFEPIFTKTTAEDGASTIHQGYWYLTAGL